MKNIIESAIAHELDHQESVTWVVCETQQIDESWVVELGEDLDFVLDFVGVVGGESGASGGLLDGDEAAVAEEGLVDKAVAAFA